MFMGFDLRQLSYFVAVGEELNLRKAAERTFVSQPALSYQMTQLEERLGIRLLERDYRGVALTEAGKVLLEGARDLLSQAERLARDVQEAGGSGEQQLTLGLIDFIHFRQLPVALREVRRVFPELKLESLNLAANEHLDAVLSRRVDIGFATLPVEHPDILARPLMTGSWMIVMPSSHRLARKKSVALTELAGEPLILFSQRVNPPLYQWLMESLRAAGFEPDIAYEINQSRLGPDLVAEGVGLWAAVTYLYRELPRQVVARPLTGLTPADMTIAMIWHRLSRSQARKLLLDRLLEEQSSGELKS